MREQLEKLNEIQQKNLALGLLIGAVLLVVMLVVVPVVSAYFTNSDEAASLTERLQTLRDVAATKADLLNKMRRLQRDSRSTQFYLKSKAANIGSSELTGIIRRVVRKHRGDVQSTRDIKVKQKGLADNVNKVAVQVVLRGNVNTLQAILYDLEMNKPFLFIDRTYVRARTVRRSRKKKSVEGELDIQIVVAGFIRGG
ncbi:MAG: hypothetical protein HOM11_14970 [Methylococcales bacterium]|jgi:hypothetical protein|nr:hypothetical protein [Methylococcales bacterium]MBT7444542.1 hypothetical protein [Methylococcales bacterium]